MSKIENVFPYTDLLLYANTNNICSWNEAIELLEKDGYIPFYETKYKEIWATPENAEEDEKSSENPILQKIIDGFCKKNKISFITIIEG